MKLIYLKSALRCDSFDLTIGIKIPFFRVSVTIEPGHSLLQFVTTNCLKDILFFSAYLWFNLALSFFLNTGYVKNELYIKPTLFFT